MYNDVDDQPDEYLMDLIARYGQTIMNARNDLEKWVSRIFERPTSSSHAFSTIHLSNDGKKVKKLLLWPAQVARVCLFEVEGSFCSVNLQFARFLLKHALVGC